MAATSREEYLKKYLTPAEGGDYKKGKKKRKEKVKAGRGMRIVDDDISWKSIAPKDDEDDLPDALLTKEEKPQIEVIDNRTKEEKIMDGYRKSNKWKTVNENKDRKTVEEENVIKINDSDSDVDVPRTLKKTRHDSDSDMELPRQKRTKSPPKTRRHDSDSDLDAVRSHANSRASKKRHDSSDSDLDLPRTSNGAKSSGRDSDRSTQRSRLQKPRHSRSDLDVPRSRNARHDSDSDLELPRSKNASAMRKERPPRGEASDSDMEVPRPRKDRHDSDSDLKLPRKKRKENSLAEAKQNRRKRYDSSSDEDRQKKARQKALMGSGGTGGLTSRSDLKKELQERKKRESDIDKLAKESQKSATVFREKGGKKRDLEKEQAVKDAEDAVKLKRMQKYNRWGKGLVQDDMKSGAIDDLVHESNKPLARYADDADLDAYQRAQVRDGDPMAQYLAKKKTKQSGGPSLPKYRGPAPAPNRYNIQPGYRWDGVNRSNGFEKKYYESMSERKALNEEKYKWSVEDM